MTPVPADHESPSAAWRVVHESGTVDDLHHLPDPVESSRMVRFMDPTGPAIVLGSSQQEAEVDLGRASQVGLEVVRRRSGGGAVLIVPGEQLWVEFLIPRGDSLWDEDIVRAADWVGVAWADALESVGVADPLVHHGRLIDRPWSRTVCFAGIGPGEVFASRRKAMGLSQRRNRGWTRIQTMVHKIWRPDVLVDALALEDQQREKCLAEVGDVAATVDVDGAALERALLTKLPD